MDFGKYKTVNGKVEIPTKDNNMSVYDLFTTAFTDNTVTVTQPSASLSTGTATTVEVGATISPNYNITFSKGSYQYGPETNITPSYSVTFNNETKTTSSGTFSSVSKSTETSLTMTAVTSWNNDTAIPEDALENTFPDLAIKAGSDTDTKTFSWKKYYFSKFSDTKITLDSSNIRSMSGSSSRVNSKTSSTSWTYFYYAAPGDQKIIKATDSNGLPITVQYTTVNVVDAGGVNTNSYTVSYIENTKAYDATTLTFVWG